jgi:molybdopterin/thiamine biosynthesis adenylyltransferase
MPEPQKLTEIERETYAWQLDLPGFDERAQQKLKGATALVSRCGGLGGPVCQNLAAAGIGRLILAHAGNLKRSDLNRQILMTEAWLGRPRVQCAAEQLRALNPRLEVLAIDANIHSGNAAELVGQADLVFDCAPLFSERLAMNAECVRQRKPMIEAGVFGLEGQVTTIVPGTSPCLACLFPNEPPSWRRRFPVLAPVPAVAAAIAAAEGLKLLTGLGASLVGTLLYFDISTMTFRHVELQRRADCLICGQLTAP